MAILLSVQVEHQKLPNRILGLTTLTRAFALRNGRWSGMKFLGSGSHGIGMLIQLSVVVVARRVSKGGLKFCAR